MSYANTIDALVTFARETVPGVLADPATGSRVRRITLDLNLVRDKIASKEKRSSAMKADVRGGFRKAEGNLKTEMNPGDQLDILAAVMRSEFVPGKTTGAATAISAVADGFTRTAGDFIADGFQIGSVVRATGFAAAVNNDNNFLVVGVGPLKLTGEFVNRDAIVAEDGAAVIVAEVGGRSAMKAEGHDDLSFSAEVYHPGNQVSKLARGVCIGDASFTLSPEGLFELDVKVLGIDLTTKNQALPYFTNPEPAGTGAALAPVCGMLVIGEQRNENMTSFSFSVTNGLSSTPVIGLNTAKKIFRNTRDVTGTFTEIFDELDSQTAFESETEQAILCVCTASPAKDAEFIAITIGRSKFTSGTDDDGDTNVSKSLGFDGLEGVDPLREKAAFAIQDSRFA